jgi:ABC-type transporter Mla MlaB component
VPSPSQQRTQAATPHAPPEHGQQAALTALDSGHYRLQGRLDLNAIPELAKQAGRLLPFGRRPSAAPPPPRIEIDLGGIDQSTSAAVALLLEWTEQAAHQRIELVLSNWPPALARIAAFSNVDGLLGLGPSEAEAT